MSDRSVRYDVDSVSDLKDLISKDPNIADSRIKDKLYTFGNDDLVLVTKVLSGALRITEIKKLDPPGEGCAF